jgi:hypothetical protein
MLQHIGHNPNRTTNVYYVNSGDASGNVTRRKVLNCLNARSAPPRGRALVAVRGGTGTAARRSSILELGLDFGLLTNPELRT